jgi:hypothetical protein
MRFREFSNITLTCAITYEGDVFYNILKYSNNEYTFAAFMRMLVRQLDKSHPGWRENTVILMDNVGFHKTDVVKDALVELKVPVLYCAPGSYDAIPCELLFSRIKQEFSKLYQARVSAVDGDGKSIHNSSITDDVTRSIVDAINNIGANVIKSAFVS